MSNVKCSIVIFDDFNNVLVAERGKGKKAIKTWGIFSKEIKESDDVEKSISKVVDKELKCTIFDLKPFKNYSFEAEDCMNYVFSGTVKEYITTHKSINSIKWIGKNDIEKYNFKSEEKAILEDFFNRL